MTADLPIACTLSGSELRLRRAHIAALGHDALVAARVEGTRADLRFATAAGVRKRVERFVAAERRCCAFMTFTVEEAPGEVVVTIDVPEDATGVLHELVAVFG
jgi:predicted transcriptional regulator